MYLPEESRQVLLPLPLDSGSGRSLSAAENKLALLSKDDLMAQTDPAFPSKPMPDMSVSIKGMGKRTGAADSTSKLIAYDAVCVCYGHPKARPKNRGVYAPAACWYRLVLYDSDYVSCLFECYQSDWVCCAVWCVQIRLKIMFTMDLDELWDLDAALCPRLTLFAYAQTGGKRAPFEAVTFPLQVSCCQSSASSIAA
jgi:hypothetical protein